jgi:hypothetical protein
LTPPTRAASICTTSTASALQQLLEHDAVVHVLARGDRDRGHGGADAGVAEDVVGARRLLDPRQARVAELPDPGDRLVHAPVLVGIDGQRHVRPDRLAGEGPSTHVVVDVGADLELDEIEPVGDRLVGEAHHLVVAVPEPPRARGVGGEAVGEQTLGAVGTA